jgi:parallel beta-helix repeat protein
MLAGVLCLLLAVTLMLAYPERAEAVKRECSGSLQKRIDAAPRGGVVNTPDRCIFRERVNVNKPLTIKGGRGTEIRGSEVWKGWNKVGSKWIRGRLPDFSNTGRCKDGTARCRWPAQVYFDGKPLRQVGSNPGQRQFAVKSGRVILGGDPSGRTVEVTTRRFWVMGRSDNVTIEGFIMRHAANGSQTGAITNNGYDDWTIRRNTLLRAHGANVNMGRGEGLKVIANNIFLAGQVGINSNRADLEVRRNRIHHNNTEDFDPGWHAGGVKSTNMRRLVATTNNVYRNDRVGFWCDIRCKNVTYYKNRIYNNTEKGIHYEVSRGGRIINNTIYGNGWGVKDTSFGEAGILVSSSSGVRVANNVLAWNNDGISVVNQNRKRDAYDTVNNVRVIRNKLITRDYRRGNFHMSLNWVKAYSGGNIYRRGAGNRGYDNKYWYPTLKDPSRRGPEPRFKWGDNYRKLSSFNGTLGERGGEYVSNGTKNRILDARNLPSRR